MMKKVSLLLMAVFSYLLMASCESTNNCYTAKVVEYDQDTNAVKVVLLSSPDDAEKQGFPTYQSSIKTYISFIGTDLPGVTYKKDAVITFLIKKCEHPDKYYTDAIYWVCEIEPY